MKYLLYVSKINKLEIFRSFFPGLNQSVFRSRGDVGQFIVWEIPG
jgi:hypothetical protein